MRTPPDGLSEERVVDFVRREWGLPAESAEHIPWGFGAWHWAATDADGIRRWFVTADPLEDAARRAEVEAAYATAHELGHELPVISPLPTLAGEICCATERFALSVSPWVEGRRFEHGELNPDLTRATARFLNVLHRRRPPRSTPVWSPRYRSHHVLAELRDVTARPWRSGPFAEQARGMVRERLADIDAWLRRYDTCAARALDRRADWVVTHGEPGPHNQVHTECGIRWVDWESVRIAPRERDLTALVASGDSRWREHYPHSVDDQNLELFDLAWRLDEIGQYTQWFRDRHEGSADDRIALGGLRHELTRPPWPRASEHGAAAVESTPVTDVQLDDWVARLADEVVEEARRRDTEPVCASGISPSGPIHLGNLREVMVPHLVCDEIRRRGIEAEHLISWDDYDRFRKVPKGIDGVDETWSEHLGKPLTQVPPPVGSTYASWAEHFRAELEDALAELGVTYRGISQSEQYQAGAYTEQVLFAMGHRGQIDKVLGQYRTLAKKAQQPKKDQKLDADQQAAADAAVEGSGAAAEDDGSGSGDYYPYRPYCTVCGTDFTTVTAYDDDTTELTYTCRCGHTETVALRDFHHGKLVWKVDWPMRWAYEKVVFEPSGVDHQSPGSSFVVGKEIVPLFGWERPLGPMYAFVGIRGMAKMSSSKGGVPTPGMALRYMEAPLLRWLYARKRPAQAFDVALDAEIQRMYDEWDGLVRKVHDAKGQPGDVAALTRATSTADGGLPQTPVTLPYRTIASVLDITTGDEEQARRILAEVDPTTPVTDLEVLRPRLDRAETWVAEQLPTEDRTVVRHQPNREVLQSLSAEEQRGLDLLLEGNGDDLPSLDDAWSIDGLTHQVYGVPKVLQGKPAGFRPDRKADPETAAALGARQREFFKLLYTLLIDKETGPRLPTLLLAVGPERLRQLLAPSE